MKKIIELFFLFRRIKLHTWIKLEDIKEDIAKADDEFPLHIYKYLSSVFGIGWIWSKMRWQRVAEILLIANSLSSPKNNQLPLLNSKSKNKPETAGWDYKGRTIHHWSHLFAKEYGWSLEYIKSISVETALALMQEILASEQLEKEFQWGLSEVSHSYDAKTKKSKFNALPRPDWMLPSAEDIVIKTIRIKASHLPVGMVITADEIIKSQTPKPE